MRPKKPTMRSNITQTTKDYASRSSIHGISYIFDKDLSLVDRLLWLFLVLVFFGVAVAMTWNFWSQWRNGQVMFLDVGSLLCVNSSFPV